MIQHYNIADLRVTIEGDMLDSLSRLAHFPPFRVAEGADPHITIHLEREYESLRGEVTYKHLHEGVEYYTVAMDEGEYGFLIHHQVSGERLSVRYRLGERSVTIGGEADDYMLLFALWLAFGVVALQYDVVSMHSSAIVYREGSVIFLGESGTGKSTHTRLWLENIEGSYLLNDDSPFVRIIEGSVYLYGSPWSGKTPCYRNERVPLVGAVRLSQAPRNIIRRHNTFTAFTALFPSAPPAFGADAPLMDRVCGILSEVLERVPVYHLEALPNGEAAQMSCNAIFGV